jgi:hypothetical protein
MEQRQSEEEEENNETRTRTTTTTTKKRKRKKNTLWELRNCRPARTASSQAKKQKNEEPERVSLSGDGGIFFSLCPYKASHYTPSPVTHLLYSQQQRAAKKNKKK